MKEYSESIKGKVLIIDDDPRNIFALKAVLLSRHINTVCASDATEGLQLIHADPSIRMVLIDIMMPDMDGYEAIREIRKRDERDVAVIAVTAQAMRGDREKSLAAGADEYLSKPIDVDKLMELITRTIR